MTQLFSPFTIRNTTFKNRMVVSPMCMYSAKEGYSTDFHLVHLGSRALGGFGLIIQEATAVSPEGRITNGDVGIWEDGLINKLKEIVAFCHSHDALVGIQLAHAGRKASCLPPFKGRKKIDPNDEGGWQTFGPTDVPFHKAEPAPLAMDAEDIQKVKGDFVSATRRAKEVGYDVLEIHMAHGYLLHQFYSPMTNRRTDDYGGSFENRIRLILEIADLVKKEWGDEKPLFVRISASDWVDEGWTIEDSVALCQRLKEVGVDVIDVSSGGIVPKVKIPVAPGYQVVYSETNRNEVNISTGAYGKITTAAQSEAILKSGQAYLILYARETLRQPNLPLQFARDLGEDITWPVQYERAKLPHKLKFDKKI